jgi:nucleotide-binding universal stress UspA family protein
MIAHPTDPRPTGVDSALFARVICGVDESPESLAAAKQARLLAGDGELTLIATADVAKAAHAGFQAAPIAQQIADTAEYALRRACATVEAERKRLVRGRPEAVLLHAIAASQSELVAVGATLHGRISEVVVGTVASTVLRNARCSVLLARTPPSDDSWPERIVLGVDGSAPSERAAVVAAALARRHEAALHVLTATAGKPTDLEHIRHRYPDVEVDPRPPADALVSAAGRSDLLVVGRRGLHGWRALGSVSERVAHRAPSSVLVVRTEAPAGTL